MAPFNLEENIREKLENREQKPSSDAWKKLESQLNKKQPKKTFKWYYLAASFVGVLIGISVFLNENKIEVKNQMVIENSQPTEAVPVESKIAPESFYPITDKNVLEKVETAKDPKQSEKELEPSPKESIIDKKFKESEMFANTAIEENTNDKEESTEIPVLQDDTFFELDEVVASINSLQKNNKQITTEEVETLLKNARHDIQLQRLDSGPKVNTTTLLEDVEWELEKSFRDKAFDALGEGFQKLRTAISQRND